MQVLLWTVFATRPLSTYVKFCRVLIAAYRRRPPVAAWFVWSSIMESVRLLAISSVVVAQATLPFTFVGIVFVSIASLR